MVSDAIPIIIALRELTETQMNENYQNFDDGKKEECIRPSQANAIHSQPASRIHLLINLLLTIIVGIPNITTFQNRKPIDNIDDTYWQSRMM